MKNCQRSAFVALLMGVVPLQAIADDAVKLEEALVVAAASVAVAVTRCPNMQAGPALVPLAQTVIDQNNITAAQFGAQVKVKVFAIDRQRAKIGLKVWCEAAWALFGPKGETIADLLTPKADD